MERLGLHPAVDPAPHQGGQREPGGGVEAVEDEPEDQRQRDGLEQLLEREVVVGGPRRRQLDVGLVLDRRQRLDLRQQLRAGRHRSDHAVHGAAAAACAASAAGYSTADRTAQATARGGRRGSERSRRRPLGKAGYRTDPGLRLVVAMTVAGGDVESGGLRRRAVGASARGGLTGQDARVDPLDVFAGTGDQQPVKLAALGQLRVGADVGQPAVGGHDRDPVGQVEGGLAVRDEQRGPAGHHPVQGGVDLRLDPGVDRGGRVVEQQQPGVGDQRPGEGDPLPLAAGERESLLADDAVVALGQLADELVGLGRPGRGEDLLLGRVRPSVGDIGLDRVGEEERLLHHHADRRPQRLLGDVADVVPADPHRAAAHVVEAGQQQAERGLAGARRPDHGDGLTRPDLKRQPAQDRLRGHVAELHVVEHDPVRVGRQVDRVGLVGDRRLGVDHLEDPDHAGPRLLADRHQVGDDPDRAGQGSEVAGEREEGTEGDVAADSQPAAEQQHPNQAERRDRGQRRVVAGGEPHHPEPGAEQEPARPLQPLHLLLFLAEPLDHADAADGLVDDPGHVADHLLSLPAGGEELLARGDRDQPERGGNGDRHQREQRRQDDHDDDRENEQDAAAQDERHPLEQLLHHVDVGDRPADELPGVDLVLARAVQVGQRLEQLGPHFVLDVKCHLAAAVATHVDAEEVRDRRDHQADRERPDRFGMRHDHVVDDRPLEQRDGQRRRRVQQRADERDDHIALETPAVPHQPPDPASLVALLVTVVAHATPR